MRHHLLLGARSPGPTLSCEARRALATGLPKCVVATPRNVVIMMMMMTVMHASVRVCVCARRMKQRAAIARSTIAEDAEPTPIS